MRTSNTVYANVHDAGGADGNVNVEGESAGAMLSLLGAGIDAVPDGYAKSASADVSVGW